MNIDIKHGGQLSGEIHVFFFFREGTLTLGVNECQLDSIGDDFSFDRSVDAGTFIFKLYPHNFLHQHHLHHL